MPIIPYVEPELYIGNLQLTDGERLMAIPLRELFCFGTFNRDRDPMLLPYYEELWTEIQHGGNVEDRDVMAARWLLEILSVGKVHIDRVHMLPNYLEVFEKIQSGWK